MFLYLLREAIDRTIHEFSKEREKPQRVSVRFPCDLFLMPEWEAFNKMLLLIQVKFLFQLRLLFNVVLDFLYQLCWKIIFRGDESQSLSILVQFFRARTDIRNDVAETADIIWERQTTHNFNKDQTHCLVMVRRNYITESYCEHYSCCPVIWPNISFSPWSIVNSLKCLPICLSVNFCHKIEANCYKMRKSEIKKNNFT